MVFAPGNVDFFIMPSQMATGDAPFQGRDYHVHNSALTAVRTTEGDLQLLAQHLGTILLEAAGPVQMLVPLGGFSSHDSTEGALHRPGLPAIFAEQCRLAFPSSVPVNTVAAHLNDEAFSDAVLAAVRSFLKENLGTGQLDQPIAAHQ